MILPLLHRSLLEVRVPKAHADNLTRVRVDALEGVLTVAVVPVVEGGGGVSLAEVVVYGAGEEDLEDDAAHFIVGKGGEVDVVETLDVGDEGWEDYEDHFGGDLVIVRNYLNSKNEPQ